jgi:hypothetical protein
VITDAVPRKLGPGVNAKRITDGARPRSWVRLPVLLTLFVVLSSLRFQLIPYCLVLAVPLSRRRLAMRAGVALMRRNRDGISRLQSRRRFL